MVTGARSPSVVILVEPADRDSEEHTPSGGGDYPWQYVPKVAGVRLYGSLKGGSWEDVVAGMTVGVMNLPSAIAFSSIAMVSPLTALHAAAVSLLTYPAFASSLHLSVSTVALLSILVGQGVSAIMDPAEADEYLRLCTVLSVMVGFIQISCGVLKLGRYMDAVPQAAIVGFISAAALTIMSSQLKDAFGVKIPRGLGVFEIVLVLFEEMETIMWLPTLLCFSTIALSLGLAKLRPGFPWFPFLIIVGAAVGFVAHQTDSELLPIVGDLPFGMPVPRLPFGTGAELVRLLPTALLVSAVAFLESIAIAKKYGDKYGYEVDTNRELTALGLMNTLVGVFGGYPTTGSFAKTVINSDMGAKTQLSSIAAGISVLICMAFLRPFLGFVPRATLAAIIISAVAKLLEIDKILRLWETSRSQFCLAVGVFFLTLIFL